MTKKPIKIDYTRWLGQGHGAVQDQVRRGPQDRVDVAKGPPKPKPQPKGK